MRYSRTKRASGSGTSGAPVGATYIVESADATLTNEVLLSSQLAAASLAYFVARSPLDALSNVGSSAIPANSAIYVAFFVDHRMTVDRVMFDIVASGATGNIDVGLYDSTGAAGAPGARLTSTGSFACPATGAVSTTITAQTLAPGLYYATVAADNATPTYRIMLNGANAVRGLHPVGYSQGTAFPLPASATPAARADDVSYVIRAGKA